MGILWGASIISPPPSQCCMVEANYCGRVGRGGERLTPSHSNNFLLHMTFVATTVHLFYQRFRSNIQIRMSTTRRHLPPGLSLIFLSTGFSGTHCSRCYFTLIFRNRLTRFCEADRKNRIFYKYLHSPFRKIFSLLLILFLIHLLTSKSP